MKKLFIVIISFMSMAIYAGERNDPTQTLFQSAECSGPSGDCEFVDFRGKSQTMTYEEMPGLIDFYTGKGTGETGVWCYESKALCVNANDEIIGLNPNFKDDYGNSFSNNSSGSNQAATQQSATPPYKLELSTRRVSNGNINVDYIKVTLIPTVSSLEVKSMIINENACYPTSATMPLDGKGKTLKMGQSVYIEYLIHCNIVKIDVVTNQGSWTHNN